MNTDLIALTKAAFQPGGPLETALREAGRPYKPNPAQQAYAEAVAATFEAGRDAQDRAGVSLLEAETGTGKTLGYLVPLCLALALRRERGFIATHTHQLMGAILEREAPVAIAVAEALTGVTLTAAQRLGVRAWLSPNAIASLLEAMRAENTQDARLPILENMLTYARDANSDGTLRGWLEENGELPQEVTAADVTLVSGNAPDADLHYARHIDESAEADLLIVSHAMLAVDILRYMRVLGDADDRPIALGVVDEGDHLPRALENAVTTHISAPMLLRLAETMGGASKKALTAAVEDFKAFMERVRRDYPVAERKRFYRLSDTGPAAACTQEARTHAMAIKKAIDGWAPIGARPRDIDNADIWSTDLHRFIQATEDASAMTAAALTWSPVLAFPTFSVVPLRAGRMVGRVLKPSRASNALPPKRAHLHSLVITSATLGDPGGKVHPFADYQHDLGLIQDAGRDWAYYLESISGRFSPTKFGSLKFAVSHSSAPVPPKPDEDGIADPEALAAWRDYVASVGALAHEEGGRTLILATSYNDAQAIGMKLRDAGVPALIESPDTNFQGLVEAFRTDPAAVFVTLRWEGLDLPGLITHLVISRIPFPNAGDLRMKVVKQELVESRGKSENEATGIMLARSARIARARLKQGIGRAIRQSTDKATIWFADARFPPPHTLTSDRALKMSPPINFYKPFDTAIPVRFREGLRETYGSAKLIPYRA